MISQELEISKNTTNNEVMSAEKEKLMSQIQQHERYFFLIVCDIVNHFNWNIVVNCGPKKLQVSLSEISFDSVYYFKKVQVLDFLFSFLFWI